MKKVRKTIKPFIYDLNQILYDCTMEVISRFKELNLVDRMHKELWMKVHNIGEEEVTRTIPKKKK